MQYTCRLALLLTPLGVHTVAVHHGTPRGQIRMTTEAEQGSAVLPTARQWWDGLDEYDRSKFTNVLDQDWFELQGADTQASYAHLASSIYSFLGEASADAHDDDSYVGFAPMMLRASFHASGSYELQSGTGGSNGGTIFHDAELADDGNGCIIKATNQLQALFKGHNVPLADAAVIAGAIALDVMNVRVDCIVK